MTGDESCPWPIDTSCVPGWADYDPGVQTNATAWATYILKSLTGHRFALCPVTVRPCYRRCSGGQTWQTYGVWAESPYGSGSSWIPFQDAAGDWRNCGGGCQGACCCGVYCEVWLPGPVGAITSVTLGGVVLDPAAYRVDNGELLVRQDGDCWPECSDQTAAAGAADTFVVVYTRGDGVPVAGQIAGGILAGEFAKGCVGAECAIPERVTSISRGGVNFELVSPTDEFDDGLTGITQVDQFIRAANPYKLRQRPTVYSPDVPAPRMQTWP